MQLFLPLLATPAHINNTKMYVNESKSPPARIEPYPYVYCTHVILYLRELYEADVVQSSCHAVNTLRSSV